MTDQQTFCTGQGKFYTHAVKKSDQPNPLAGQDYKGISWEQILYLAANPQTVAKDDAWWFLPSTYKGSLARTGSVQKTVGRYEMLVADIDKGNHTLSAVVEATRAVLGQGAEFLVHSSRSARVDNKKWHVLARTDTPLTGSYYKPFAQAFAQGYAAHHIIADPAMKNLTQPVYLPNRGEEYEHHPEQGKPIIFATVGDDGVRIYEHPLYSVAAGLYEARQAELKATGRRTDDKPAPWWVQLYNSRHTEAELLEEAGFESPNGIKWRHPSQTSASHGTDVDEDGWVTSSATVAGWGWGHGKNGDAFDIFAGFYHGNNHKAAMNAVLEIYSMEALGCAGDPKKYAEMAQHGKTLVDGLNNGTLLIDGKTLSGDMVDRIAPLFELKFTTGTEETAKMEHFIDPWLPKGIVVGLYGRGESGKSSWASTLCAEASDQISTLWITSEEEEANVRVRYSKTKGEANTLVVLPYTPKDAATGKTVVYDIHEHLEKNILDMKDKCQPNRPLGVVVLDAVGTLVTWKKGENANDDGAVKRLLAHLHGLAERHGVTVLIIGHLNKNTNKTHGADAVTGSAAWTNSVRRAFMFYKDVASEGDYDFFIRTAKANTGTHFAAGFSTAPVHILHTRECKEACNEVLCQTKLNGAGIAWGDKAINNLINDADEEDPNHEAKQRRASKKQGIREAVINAIREGGCTTRATVLQHLGGVKIAPRDWTAMDAYMQLNCGIVITKGEHGSNTYS